MIAIGDKANNRWYLQFGERWVVQYNFYVNDERWGRMFVRMCPHLPLSAQPPSLAGQSNARGGHRLSPALERVHGMRQIRAPAGTGRRVDAARPHCLRPEVARLFQIERMDLANPVNRSHYRNGFIKQYVRDHLILRTEASTNNVTDYGVNKAIENLPALRRVLDALGPGADRYTLASLRYDLSKLRAKGLIEKLPHSRCYRLLPNGYSICLVFLKLSERIYAPLIAGLLSPARAGGKLHCQSRSQPREVAMALPPSRETPVWFISGCSCGFGRQLAKSSSIAATASPRQRAIRSSSPTSPRSRGRAGAEARRQ